MSKQNTNLEQVMLDAKEMKSFMQTSVKESVMESLQPRINSIVSQKLAEMDCDDDENMDEDFDFASLMQEVEDEHDSDEPMDDAPMGDEPTGDEPMGDEALVSDMTATELMDFIKDAVKQAIGGDEAPEEDATDMMGDDMEDKDEVEEGIYESDLDAILAEIEDEGYDKGEDKDEKLMEQVKFLKKELADSQKSNTIYKKSLMEAKLLFSQLVYTNKLLAESEISKDNIVKFAEIIEKTKTPEEVKNLYEAIRQSLTSNKSKKVKEVKPQSIKESWGLGSNKILPKQTTNKPLNESANPFTQWKINAGIIKNK
jgi:hypothetical protein